MKALEKEIDDAVFAVYGLSEQEQRFIESADFA